MECKSLCISKLYKLYYRTNDVANVSVGSVFMRSEIVLSSFGRGCKQTDFVLPQIRVNTVCVMPQIARTLNNTEYKQECKPIRTSLLESEIR